MSRIPSHSVDDAPDASRPILQKIAQASPNGRPLNLHAQMAHSPAVLAAYASLRAAVAEHSALDQKTAWALNVAAAAATRNDYMVGIATRFARMSGWTDPQIAALVSGKSIDDAKVDALARVVSEAAVNSGNVMDATWKAAQRAGWSDTELADAFANLGLTVFTGYFLNYAQTAIDA